MERLRETLWGLIKELEDKNLKGQSHNPQEWLKNILTKKELRHIRVNYFKKGVLGLAVDSSSLLYSLNLRKEELLALLQKESKGIEDIRFRIGELK
jgi:hypothetical protein